VPLQIVVDVKSESSSESVSHVYALRAVICHRGGSETAGHYTAFMQVNAEEAPAVNGWLEFDDLREDALQTADEKWILSEAVTQDSSVLFYKRDAGPAPAAMKAAAAAVLTLTSNFSQHSLRCIQPQLFYV